MLTSHWAEAEYSTRDEKRGENTSLDTDCVQDDKTTDLTDLSPQLPDLLTGYFIIL